MYNSWRPFLKMAATAAMLDIFPGSHSFFKQYHIRKLSAKFSAFPKNRTIFAQYCSTIWLSKVFLSDISCSLGLYRQQWGM
jgi:hypothetical protein